VVLSAAASCPHHPDREAIGVCVFCRTPVCSECSTKVDGINHCVACLQARSGAVDADGALEPPRAHPIVAAVGGFTSLAVLAMLVWIMLEVLLPEVP
jgi:hypothetical protein